MRLPACMDVPRPPPGVQRGPWHAECARQIGWPPLVRPKRVTALRACPRWAQVQLVHQGAQTLEAQPAAVGGPVALRPEPFGDGHDGEAIAGQLAHALTELGVRAQGGERAHRPENDVLRLPPAAPADGHVDPLGRPLDVHDDAVDDLSHEGFAVCGRGGRRLPERQDIRGEVADRLPLFGREEARLLAQEPMVVLLEVLLRGQRRLPRPLQRARHQPVLGLDGEVLPRRPVGLVPRPFQALLPQAGEVVALLLQAVGGGQRQLQRRRLQGREDPLAHERV